MNQVVPVIPKEQHRFQLERQFVGTLIAMSSASAVKHAHGIVKPDHFADLSMARMFYLLGQVADAGLNGPKLGMGLLQKLSDDAPLLAADKITPQGLIHHCVAYSAPGIAMEQCARMVKIEALKVDLDNATEQGDMQQVQTIAAALDELERAQFGSAHTFRQIGTVVERVVTELNIAYQADTDVKDYAHVALTDLRKMIGGWRRKRFYIIAGRPGMGKTTVTLSTMLRTAQQGHGVLFFSKEMGEDELAEIALCDLAWRIGRRIEYRDISADKVRDPDFEARFSEILQVRPLFNSLPFLINDKPGLTMAQIRAQAVDYQQRLAAEGRRLDVLVVDHLGKIKPTGAYRGNKVAETAEVSNGLKELAKELDCAVIALCQLSRATEGREDKRPGLSDLRWAGEIEQDADCVIMAYREEYYLRKAEADGDKELQRQDKLAKCKNQMQLFIEKNRQGPTGEVRLFCDVACGVVRNLGEEKWHG
mgnify:CR=1 FL=1